MYQRTMERDRQSKASGNSVCFELAGGKLIEARFTSEHLRNPLPRNPPFAMRGSSSRRGAAQLENSEGDGQESVNSGVSRVTAIVRLLCSQSAIHAVFFFSSVLYVTPEFPSVSRSRSPGGAPRVFLSKGARNAGENSRRLERRSRCSGKLIW